MPQKISRKNLLHLALIAFLSAIWLLYRTARKPSRIIYPCQQTAIINIEIFRLAFFDFINIRSKLIVLRRFIQPIILVIILISSIFFTLNPTTFLDDDSIEPVYEIQRIPIIIEPQENPFSESASDLFFIQNATGIEGNMDSAINALIHLMSEQGIHFFKNSSQPEGLIANDDVIILKVNCQWPSRGGTNTDLVKGVINTIVNHPNVFSGEIVIADNGQGYGNLNWDYGNSFYRNQSMTDLLEVFPTHKVSTKLWDRLRNSTVEDYDKSDFTDGYVHNDTWNPDTELYVSYPKWQTPFGTYISFNEGIWENETGFNSEKLKVINIPVMKSHFRYGVTGCIKHYMGVPQGLILEGDVPHEHFSIALGGMGTLMANTRFPILNILDAIWINAHPAEGGIYCGPQTTYRAASFTDIICASQDPVALDYYSSKNILMATADYENHTRYSSFDPDYDEIVMPGFDGSFHDYLRKSMIELVNAGFQVTMNQTEMNVYVSTLPGIPTTTLTTPTSTLSDIPEYDYLPLLIILPVTAVIFISIVIMVVKRRNATTTALILTSSR